MFQRAMVLISLLSTKRSKQSHTTAKPMPSVWKSYFKHKQNQTLHMPPLLNICQNVSEYLLLECQCGQVKKAKKKKQKTNPTGSPSNSSRAFFHTLPLYTKDAVSFNYHHKLKITQNQVRWWRRQWHPTPVLLPGKSHGWRSLVGCSPWGCYESDTTERLHFHFSLSCIGEGNGNPLQCSCLENPRDGGASWAAVYGVAQTRIRLKRFSTKNVYDSSSFHS